MSRQHKTRRKSSRPFKARSLRVENLEERRLLSGTPGDYNTDGLVDTADYTVWRDHLGSAMSLPNEDPEVTPGYVTWDDYIVWKSNFGLPKFDHSDAPEPYPVTLAENGARHNDAGPTLGATRDVEADGIHSAAADADGADEDGVTFGTIQVGALDATLTVNVQNAPAGAKLDGWIDFNVDGNWGSPGEQIFASVDVADGDNVLEYDVPSWALSGTTYARFRLSTAGELGIVGPATNGEVEDYQVEITPPVALRGLFGEEKIISSDADKALNVIATDLDGDGDMDVLSTSQDDNTIAWHENDGNQNFTTHAITTTVDSARLFSVDLDGDGDMDLLSAIDHPNQHRIAWYENNGSQTFTEHIVSTTAGRPQNVSAADVDGDGDLDILSASMYDDKIAWHENDGDQNFTQRVISTNANRGRDVFAADVDGDGDLDLLSASDTDDKIAWYENNGSQEFTEHTISTSADFARSVLAADVDDDGDMDVISASAYDDKVAWYKNDGSQTFTEHVITTNADDAYEIFAADVDGDGDLDVLSASQGDDKIAWYENDGSENFTERVISNNADLASDVFVVDIDGDGDLDILSASGNDDKIAWYENNVIPTLDPIADRTIDEDAAQQTVYLTGISDGEGGTGPIAADFTQWRVEDGGNGHWYYYETQNPKPWLAAQEYAESIGGHLATITSAAEQDFIKTLTPAADHFFLGGFQNTSSSSYSEPGGGWEWITGEAWSYTNWHVTGPAPPEPNEGTPGQNFLTQHGAPVTSWGWNDGTGTGPSPFLIELETAPAASQPLRVTASSSSPGTFAAATAFAVGNNPTSVAVGDFNGDGNQDLVVANVDSDNVSILLGNGDGTFAAATNFADGDWYAVSVGDFSGDGNQDLAVANTNSDSVSILASAADHSLRPPIFPLVSIRIPCQWLTSTATATRTWPLPTEPVTT
jgi:hypothetical protein